MGGYGYSGGGFFEAGAYPTVGGGEELSCCACGGGGEGSVPWEAEVVFVVIGTLASSVSLCDACLFFAMHTIRKMRNVTAAMPPITPATHRVAGPKRRQMKRT